MKKKIMLIIIILICMFGLVTCIEPEFDPTDIDNDGVTGYEDVDDIVLTTGDNINFDTATPVLIIKLLNPDIVTKYWIQISISYDNFDDLILFSRDDFTTNECQIPSGILYDSEFFWRAKAWDDIRKRWSDSWSEIDNFKVFAGVSYLIPADNDTIIDSTPFIDWPDFPGAIKYNVQIGLNLEYEIADLIEESSNLSESQYQIIHVFDGSDIVEWRTKHCNEDGFWSDWSESHKFWIHVPVPSNPIPVDGGFVKSTIPTILDWEDIPGAGAYELSASQVGGDTFASYLLLTDSEFSIDSKLLYDKDVTWEVRTQNEDGKWSLFSLTKSWNFRVRPITFQEKTISTHCPGIWTAEISDMDGDGDLDILSCETSDYNVVWRENDGTGGFSEHNIDTLFTGSYSLKSVDLDQDGDIDVLGCAKTLDTIAWWENDDSQNFIKHDITINFDSVLQIDIVDLNVDGYLDIIGMSSLGEMSWWENDGSQMEMSTSVQSLNTSIIL